MTIFDLAPAAVILPLMTAGLDFVFYRRPNVQRVVSLAAVVAVALVPSGPLAEAWQQREPDAAQRQMIQARQRAVEQVPEGVSVAADLSALTRLVPGRDVHWIGTAGDPAPEYLVLQTDGATWGGRGPADPGAYAREHYGASYDVVFRERSVVVLCRA